MGDSGEEGEGEEGEEEGERVMDETERQALQEAEDERIARELEEKEKKRLLLVVGSPPLSPLPPFLPSHSLSLPLCNILAYNISMFLHRSSVENRKTS